MNQYEKRLAKDIIIMMTNFSVGHGVGCHMTALEPLLMRHKIWQRYGRDEMLRLASTLDGKRVEHWTIHYDNGTVWLT